MFKDWANKIKQREIKYFSWKRMLVVGILFALILRFFIVEKFYIYSVSMLPTIHSHEGVWISKYDYGYSRFSFPFTTPIVPGVRLMSHQPQLGDVAVFVSPRANERWPYIKRIMAVPGDRFEMNDGRVLLNGKMLPRQEIVGYEREDKHNRLYVYRQYLETLPNGLQHRIVELSDNRLLDNIQEILIPEGYYLFMGDNRDESEDSRGSLGLIPFENIIGKAHVDI